MSNLDLLLKLDVTKLERPTKKIEIKRLSGLTGEPFIVTCQAITADEFAEIQDSISIDADGGVSLDKNIQVQTILIGTKDPNFGSQEVIEHFGVVTATEAINKIFYPGEISAIYETITNLSGFGKDAVQEVKNS